MEDEFKATDQRDEIIEKLLRMGLTINDLEWLAEGIMDLVTELKERYI